MLNLLKKSIALFLMLTLAILLKLLCKKLRKQTISEIMLQNRLNNFKHYYIDTVDPEGAVAKLAFRTAFACAVSIILFQLLANDFLSTWAGFATFAIVQNDTQELFFSRLRFLVGIVITITLFVFLGMLIGNHVFLFILSIPPLIFVCAYIACLGFSYFNAGAWAAFLYILAGASPTNLERASQIAVTILICGAISLLVCFLVFPVKPYRIIMQSYERVFAKLRVLLHSYQNNNQKHKVKFNAQLDQMLALQEKNLTVYLAATKLPANRQECLINLAKLLYQISLMIKSTLTFQHQVSKHNSYPIQLESCNHLVEGLINELITQLRYKERPNFTAVKIVLEAHREALTAVRKSEIAKLEPDFIAMQDNANYFYHFIKLTELLEMASINIARLQEIS